MLGLSKRRATATNKEFVDRAGGVLYIDARKADGTAPGTNDILTNPIQDIIDGNNLALNDFSATETDGYGKAGSNYEATYKGKNIKVVDKNGGKFRNMKIYGNSEQGLFSQVPQSTYVPLEYLTKTAESYINTGYYWSDTTDFIDIDFETSSTSLQYLCGGRISTTNQNNIIAINPNINNYYIGRGTSGPTTSSITTILNYKYNVFMSKSNVTRNNYGDILTSTLSSQHYIQTGTVQFEYLIGTVNENGAPRTNGLIGKIYRVKIGDNNRVVRDYVPVRRISDNAVGLYDLINKTFATTPVGTFTAGTAIIPTPENPIEINSVGKVYNLYNTTMEQGDISAVTGLPVVSSARVRTANFIKVDGGAKYTILRKTTGTGAMGVRRYDINYNFLGTSSVGENRFTTTENCAYIKFIDENKDLNMEYSIYKGYNNTYFDKGKTYIREKSYNNLLDLKDMNNWGLPRAGLDITDKGNGVYNFKGTATTNFMIIQFYLNDFLSKINPNKYYRFKYKISGNYGAARFDLFYFYKSNSSDVDVTSSTIANSSLYNNFILKPFNLTNSWKFALSFYNFTSGQEYDFDIQVSLTEYGSEADVYSYNYDIEDFPLSEPLRAIEVPNTESYNIVKDGKYYIADYVDFKNKKVVRRIAPFIINGTETISGGEILTNTYIATIQALPGGLVTSNNKIRCEQLFTSFSTGDNSDYEHIRSSTYLYPNIVSLQINKSRLSEVSFNGVRTWLASNNIKGNYILKTPIETQFTAEQEAVANLMSFENYTEIIVDDEVEPLNIETELHTNMPVVTFDGTNSYMSIDGSENLNITGTQNFCISVVLLIESGAGTGYVVAKNDTGFSDVRYGLAYENGVFKVISSGVVILTSNRIYTDEWYRVSVLRENGILYLYVNGVIHAQVASTTSLLSSEKFRVGCRVQGEGNTLFLKMKLGALALFARENCTLYNCQKALNNISKNYL